jgi:bacterioferritin-associated ferredoxin
MKTIQRLIVLAGLLLGAASVTFAGQGIQYWKTLHEEAEFKALKAGDKIAYVCNQCNSVTEKTVASTAEAMALCKDGAMVMCPSCKKEVKVVLKRQRNDAPTHEEITYVNDKGEPCLFIAKVTAK